MMQFLACVFGISLNKAAVFFRDAYNELMNFEDEALIHIEEEITRGTYSGSTAHHVYFVATTLPMKLHLELISRWTRSTSSYFRDVERKYNKAVKMIRAHGKLPLPSSSTIVGFERVEVDEIKAFLDSKKRLWRSGFLPERQACILFGSFEILSYFGFYGGLEPSEKSIWQRLYNEAERLKEERYPDGPPDRYDDDAVDAWCYEQMTDTHRKTIDPRKEKALAKLYPQWAEICEARIGQGLKTVSSNWKKFLGRLPEDLYKHGRLDCGGCPHRHPVNKIVRMICPGCNNRFDNLPRCIGLESFDEAKAKKQGDNDWLCRTCKVAEAGDGDNGGDAGDTNKGDEDDESDNDDGAKKPADSRKRRRDSDDEQDEDEAEHEEMERRRARGERRARGGQKSISNTT